MNETQRQISKLLWTFESLKQEHVIKICNCTESDINYLISKKVIEKDKNTRLLKYKNKEINMRNVIAFDVVMNYLDRNAKIQKGRYPINVSMKTNQFSYDIIVIKEMEIDALFDKIDEISKADKVIIVIGTKQYIKKFINTKRPCCICTYSPLTIVDMVN